MIARLPLTAASISNKGAHHAGMAESILTTTRAERKLVKKIHLLFLICLTTALLGAIPGGTVWAFDGDDGGQDDGGSDDDGENDDDEGDQHDGHGHHGGGHHAPGGFGPDLGWGYGPGYYNGFGFGGLGGYGFMPPFYPLPYNTYPPVAVQRIPPPVYVEQQNSAQPAPQPQSNYWHYCRAAEGYYPQVQECPEGWQQVAPQPKNANLE